MHICWEVPRGCRPPQPGCVVAPGGGGWEVCVLWGHPRLPFSSTTHLPQGEPGASGGFWNFTPPLPPPQPAAHLTEVLLHKPSCASPARPLSLSLHPCSLCACAQEAILHSAGHPPTPAPQLSLGPWRPAGGGFRTWAGREYGEGGTAAPTRLLASAVAPCRRVTADGFVPGQCAREGGSWTLAPAGLAGSAQWGSRPAH